MFNKSKLFLMGTFLVLSSKMSLAAETPQSLKRIPGVVQGFGSLPVDDIVDGAIVLKSFSAEDLLNFQIEQFIAPDEPLKAGPETVNVPGNFYFPRQLENWGLFRIAIEKGEFGFYTPPGEKNELIASSFKAPFSTLVDMAQSGNTTPAKLLPLVQLQKLSYLGEKDWSNESKINFNLNSTFANRYSFDWSRAKTGTDQTDHVFVFQQTPANKWALMDLVGNSRNSGNLKSLANFPQKFKSLFIRLLEVNKKVVSIQALVKSYDSNTTKISASGVAGSINGVKLNGQTLTWTPMNESGWLVILQQRPQLLGRVFEDFLGLSFGFQNQMTLSIDKTWVRPDAGTYQFTTPIGGNDNIALVMAKTDMDLPQPTDSQSFSDLFDHTTEIRFYNAK
ncbi:MAG: hypothetical protein KA116_11560 [Proteobacteria bacterium]|nr:hypothetical protein [Pseudomonadota bacterium]